jgi:hypothetical protein
MKLQSSIALAAISAMLVVPNAYAAPAKAKAKVTKVQAKSEEADAPEKGLTPAEELEYTQQRLAQLQAQINDLTDKVGAAAAKKDLADATKAANAKADAAAKKADEAKAAAGKVEKAVGAVKWAADTNVSGRLYINFSNIVQHTAGAANANTGTGVNLKRAYVTVAHKFDNVFSSTLTLDAENVVGQTNTQNPVAGTTSIVGKGMYVKQAYGEAKINPKLTVRVGSAGTTWIPYSEEAQGFRHVEKPFIDRIGYGQSADWGVHALGDLYKGKKSSLSYAVAAVNGAGYRQVKVTNSVDFEGRLSGTVGNFYAAVGGYTGKRGANVQSLTTTPTTFHTATRVDGVVGYRNAKFNVGAEYMYAKNWNNVAVNPATNLLSQDSAEGYSLFSSIYWSPKWTTFARYDDVKTSKIVDPKLKDKYFNAGIQYSPVKNVDLALVYKRETVTHGALSTANGVIGTSTSATANSAAGSSLSGIVSGKGTYDEIGIFTQFRF